ncbi:hypothetical protein [Klebsiella pneumoniae]|nr:hypothetical protein [Klebsiella pneumoniae]
MYRPTNCALRLNHTGRPHLASTAMVTEDTPFETYRHGVDTITAANEAANGLLSAEQRNVDAYTSALIAAANLAFVMGEMTQASGNIPNTMEPPLSDETQETTFG